MKKIYRYLLVNIARTSLYVLMVLTALYAVFELLVEGSEFIKYSDNYWLSFQYILIRFPVYLYEMAPLAVLVGVLIGLARLALSNEYVIIRTGGVSLSKITRLLLLFGVIAGVLVGAAGEYAVPYAEKISDQLTAQNKGGTVSILGKYNVWLKLDNEIIELWEVLPDYSFKNVLRYQTVDNKQLAALIFARRATYVGHSSWRLDDVSALNFTEGRVVARKQKSVLWRPNFDLKLLEVLINKPKNMSVQSLRQYILHLEKNHQKTLSYRIAMWKKIFYPWSLLVMVLIALIFVPVINRYSNLGLKIVCGVFVGLVYFFLLRFFGYFVQIIAWNPFWAMALPSLLFITGVIAVLYFKSKDYR